MNRLRITNGYSRADFANALRGYGFEWNTRSVEGVEAGTRPVTLGEAILLAKFFGLSLADFLDASEDIDLAQGVIVSPDLVRDVLGGDTDGGNETAIQEGPGKSDQTER